MYAFLAEKIVRHRRPILLMVLAAAIFGATNLPRLGFDFTPQQLFRSTSDAADYREKFAARFGREDNLVFVLLEPDDAYAPKLLEFQRDLTLRLRDLGVAQTAESIATMEIPRAGDSPGVLSTRPILPATGPVTPEQAKRLEKLATTEPLVKGRLVGTSGKSTGVLVWLDRDIEEIKDLDRAVDEIRHGVDQTQHRAGVDVGYRLGGIPYLRTEIVDSLKFQQLTFIPGTALAYILLLFLLFRRPSGVLLPMGVVAVASLMTVSLLVLTGSSINIINNVLPSLIFIIAVSDSIHMLVRDAEESEVGAERGDAVRAMVRHTGLACLLTSTTTAVGFFSLLAADTDVLRDFGWEAGFGVLFAYVVTLFFLPAALVYMRPVKRREASDEVADPLLERALVRVGGTVLNHPWAFIAGGLLVAGAAAYAASTVAIDTTLLEVYDAENPSYQTTMLLEREFGGVLPVEISLESDERDAFKDPAVYAKMREIETYGAKDDIVLSTQSFVDFQQAARAALLGDPKQRDVMPDSRAQIEQLQLLIGGEPDSQTGVNRYVTSDFRNARILLRVSDAGARAQLRLAKDLKKKLAKLFPPNSGIRYRITGDAYVASQALDSFIRDLFYSLLLAMVIIFGMMTLVFRSLKVGLISILPNIIPLVLTFGYMGLMHINLNTTTVIIFAISLGLAVDDTIHFLSRFREERAKQPTVREAILATYDGAGRAIVITSVMLLTGLIVLLFSDFVPTRYFGTLMAITIAGALLGDLLLLPPILYLVYRGSDAE